MWRSNCLGSREVEVLQRNHGNTHYRRSSPSMLCRYIYICVCDILICLQIYVDIFKGALSRSDFISYFDLLISTMPSRFWNLEAATNAVGGEFFSSAFSMKKNTNKLSPVPWTFFRWLYKSLKAVVISTNICKIFRVKLGAGSPSRAGFLCLFFHLNRDPLTLATCCIHRVSYHPVL